MPTKNGVIPLVVGLVEGSRANALAAMGPAWAPSLHLHACSKHLHKTYFEGRCGVCSCRGDRRQRLELGQTCGMR